MGCFSRLLAVSPLLALGNCHAVILGAQGIQGSPSSVGFQVDPAVARNCISISPCQQDTTIIRDAEIKANVVNSCGRTQLKGNIDVGENTENALAAKAVTQVKAGTDLTVTLHQVNADGAGPFVCDIDQTGNGGTRFDPLNVLNNVPGANGLSQIKMQAFNMTVQLPKDLNCSGGSTGNTCTVRCRNNAVAGPFGGCFAIQQVDNKPTVNSASQITTAQNITSIQEQIQKNQADFKDAMEANRKAGADEAKQNLAAVNALLKASVTSKTPPVQTPPVNPSPPTDGKENGNGNRKAKQVSQNRDTNQGAKGNRAGTQNADGQQDNVNRGNQAGRNRYGGSTRGVDRNGQINGAGNAK